MGRVSRALAKAHRPPLSGKRSDTRPTVGSNCLPSRALGLQVATGRIQQASLLRGWKVGGSWSAPISLRAILADPGALTVHSPAWGKSRLPSVGGCSTLCAWSSWARKRRQND